MQSQRFGRLGYGHLCGRRTLYTNNMTNDQIHCDVVSLSGYSWNDCNLLPNANNGANTSCQLAQPKSQDNSHHEDWYWRIETWGWPSISKLKWKQLTNGDQNCLCQLRLNLGFQGNPNWGLGKSEMETNFPLHSCLLLLFWNYEHWECALRQKNSHSPESLDQDS